MSGRKMYSTELKLEIVQRYLKVNIGIKHLAILMSIFILFIYNTSAILSNSLPCIVYLIDFTFIFNYEIIFRNFLSDSTSFVIYSMLSLHSSITAIISILFTNNLILHYDPFALIRPQPDIHTFCTIHRS